MTLAGSPAKLRTSAGELPRGGGQTYGQIFKLDGKPAAGMEIFLSPGANALAVAREVSGRMDELAQAFPQGLAHDIPFDTTV